MNVTSANHIEEYYKIKDIVEKIGTNKGEVADVMTIIATFTNLKEMAR